MSAGEIVNQESLRRRLEGRTDGLVITAVAATSLLPYLGRLGFYSDDWAFLAMARSADSTVLGTFERLHAENRMRPLGDLLRALQLNAFGTWPLGYHLVDALALVGVALLLRHLLRSLGARREHALAAGCLWTSLPHYSTLRAWPAAGVVPLSLFFALASIAFDIDAVRHAGRRRIALRTASIVALTMSLLCYELVLPLMAAAALCLRGIVPRPRSPSPHGAGIAWNLLPIALLASFKALIPDRFGAYADDPSSLLRDIVVTLVRTDYGPGDSGLNLPAVIEMYAGTYGLWLPWSAATAAEAGADGTTFLMATLAGVLTGIFVARASEDDHPPVVGRRALALLPLGLSVIGLGYAIFLTNGNIQVSPTGTGNRTAAVASVGVAITIVALLAAIFRGLRSKRATRGFAVCVAIIAFLYSMISGALMNHWLGASREQERILLGLRSDVPPPPPESTLLVDGVCRYVGPAPVFEAPWDLEGAVRILYDDPTLRAAVLSPTFTVTEESLRTSDYDSPTSYSFRSTWIYHARKRETHAIPDRASAERYLREVDGDSGRSCPPGFGGWGVSIFSDSPPGQG